MEDLGTGPCLWRKSPSDPASCATPTTPHKRMHVARVKSYCRKKAKIGLARSRRSNRSDREVADTEAEERYRKGGEDRYAVD